MKINGKAVKTIFFTRYCKSRLGHGMQLNVKLYDLVCMALEVDGMPMPMDKTSKQWVTANLDHILGTNELEKLKSCGQQSKESTTAQKRAAASLRRQVRYADRPKLSPKKTFSSGVDVTSDAFLSTYEWRKVRMVALTKYGPKCMCCGTTPAQGAVMNVDHIKPRKLWPSLALDVSNLQILCHDCNHGKGNWDQTDWRK